MFFFSQYSVSVLFSSLVLIFTSSGLIPLFFLFCLALLLLPTISLFSLYLIICMYMSAERSLDVLGQIKNFIFHH